MSVFQAILGYSAGQADDVRKEIDKLNRAHSTEGRTRLNARKDEFIVAATEKISVEDADRIWAEILPFTGYSFNRAHATGYAIQAYQDAWLKRYHPTHFYAALLTTSSEFAHRASREARHFNVVTVPPDINRSKAGFTVDHESNALRYGLSSIDGVGDVAAAQIMEDRPFASLEHFTEISSRKYSKVNKGTRQKLLDAGALDCFGGRIDWDPIDRARREYELLGVALEPGGLLGLQNSAIVWENIYSEQEIEELPVGTEVIVGGSVVIERTTTIKRGRQRGAEMAFLRVSLDLDSWTVTAFPDVWTRIKIQLEDSRMLMVRGKKDDRGSIIGQQTMLMGDFLQERGNTILEAD